MKITRFAVCAAVASVVGLGVVGLGVVGAQSTERDPDAALGELFDDPSAQGPGSGERVLRSVSDGGPDLASGGVSPSVRVSELRREGTFVIDRVGTVRRGTDGGLPEFVFESDAEAMGDPPVLLLPNLKLMQVEDALDAAGTVRFRITGEVTEYRGRNYVLLQKVIVLR